MFSITNGTTMKSPPPITKIKINSPKSEVKVLHKLSFNRTIKLTPEPPKQGNDSIIHSDEKVTQAWNKLKNNALSKAIAIGPDVGPCSFALTSRPTSSLDCNKSDSDNIDKLDLGEAITSTPLKSESITNVKNKKTVKLTYDTAENISPCPFDVSEITPVQDNSFEEFEEIEAVRKLCWNKMEAKIITCGQKKKDDLLREWCEYEEKLKEKQLAYKIELEKEQLLRIEKQNIEAQKLIMESKASAQLITKQQELIRHAHDKKIAEKNEKIKLIEQQRKDLEEKQKQKREELKQCINDIYKMQVAYGEKYNQINEITKKCRNTRMLNEKVLGELSQLKRMNEQILKLVEKSKEGKVTLSDLKAAELLNQQISAIHDVFARHTDDINQSHARAEEARKREQQETEMKAKQEVERQQKAQEDRERVDVERQQKAQEDRERVDVETHKKELHPVKLGATIEDCVSRESLLWYLDLCKYLEDYEKSLQPLLMNDSLKKFRFDCKKLVNVPVNAISPLDDLHLQDKEYKLKRLLQGQAVPVGNTLFHPTGHPLGVPFCTNLLAKKLVKQGEHVVSSKPESAFAIAAVIVALWVDFPDFGRLLLAHFHRECPYLIPAFLPQIEGQSNEDYYRVLGYQYSEDGKVESQNKFLQRMSGIMRLYAAILVTPLKRSHAAEGKRHPHNMRDAWRWLAATLNLSPRPDISPTLLFDFLEVTGHMFYTTYGAQFGKLLQTLCTDYFPLIEQATPDGCGGPVVRLKSFLEKILKEGRVAPPMGLLPRDFW